MEGCSSAETISNDEVNEYTLYDRKITITSRLDKREFDIIRRGSVPIKLFQKDSKRSVITIGQCFLVNSKKERTMVHAIGREQNLMEL